MTNHDDATIRAGGFSLLLGAIAFMGVFTFLAAQFGYPALLPLWMIVFGVSLIRFGRAYKPLRAIAYGEA